MVGHRRIIGIAMFLLMLIVLSAPAGAVEPAKAKYTVMVYLNGSDLESLGGSMTNDLIEMMQVGSNKDMHVVVETLGTKEWKLPWVDPKRNQRWYITRDGTKDDGSVTAESMKLVNNDIGLRRLADPATLTDFITWSVKNYPAEKYVLIFEDHGAGSVNGFGQDEQHDDEALLLDGIRKGVADAIAATGASFELIGFDTCLMATVEVAHMLQPYSKYLVASEELEPGHGWNYTANLQAIEDNPNITGEELGKAIIKGFQGQAKDWGQDKNITLSLTDLSKIDGVVIALENFVKTVSADVVADVERIKVIAKARVKAEDYGVSAKGSSDMVDLGDLAEKAATAYPEASAQLINALKEAVLYKIGSPGKPNGHGLSVYFPMRDRNGAEESVLKYQKHTPFSKVYKDFITDFTVNYLLADTSPPELDQKTPEQTEGGRYSVKLKQESADEISAIYSVLARVKADNPDRILMLGMDNDVEFNEQTGEVLDNFTGETVTLNGHYVSMFFESETESAAQYYIPAKLNGKVVDIKVIYDFKTDKVQVAGAWPGVHPVSGMAFKDLIKIKHGDKITPLFFYYDAKTDQEGFEEGKEFTVAGGLDLGLTDLPKGTYLYGFMMEDLFGNEEWSEFVEVDVVDDPAAEQDPNLVRVYLNGGRMAFDVNPEIQNGRTLVPFRAIVEALGAEVAWDGATQTITATKGTVTVTLQINNPKAGKNGQEIALAAAPVISNGRTLVPLRFLSEAFGATVDWDGASRSVIITTGK